MKDLIVASIKDQVPDQVVLAHDVLPGSVPRKEASAWQPPLTDSLVAVPVLPDSLVVMPISPDLFVAATVLPNSVELCQYFLTWFVALPVLPEYIFSYASISF